MWIFRLTLSTREWAGALCVAIERHFRNLEIMITMIGTQVKNGTLAVSVTSVKPPKSLCSLLKIMDTATCLPKDMHIMLLAFTLGILHQVLASSVCVHTQGILVKVEWFTGVEFNVLTYLNTVQRVCWQCLA